MSEWSNVTINECCDILDNQRIPLNEDQRGKIPGSIPYYGANGVQGFIDKFLFDEDLILIAEDGGNFEEYSTRPIAYRIYGKSWVNNHAHILKAKENYDQNFIFYSLVNKNIITFIKGGTRSKLNQKELQIIKFDIPTKYNEQRKIASILTAIDNVIEKTQAAIEKYKSIKQGMMHDLFTRGIDPKTGTLRPKYGSAPEMYKKTELGFVPNDWSISTLCNISTLLTDGSHNSPKPTQSDYLIATVKDMLEDDFNYKKCTSISQKDFIKLVMQNCSPEKNDILLSKDGTIGCWRRNI